MSGDGCGSPQKGQRNSRAAAEMDAHRFRPGGAGLTRSATFGFPITGSENPPELALLMSLLMRFLVWLSIISPSPFRNTSTRV
jgi:hypothetical protein